MDIWSSGLPRTEGVTDSNPHERGEISEFEVHPRIQYYSDKNISFFKEHHENHSKNCSNKLQTEPEIRITKKILFEDDLIDQ